MKKGFTLLELIITLLVVFILVTVGGVSYKLVLEKAKARVCATNQEVILRAVKVASLEAGVLGELDNERYLEHIGNAYAQVMKESGWWTRFSYFFVRLNTPPEVYADVGKYVDPQYMKKYGVEPQVLVCPSDRNGPPSYGVNTALEGIKWGDINEGIVVVGDCDNVSFTQVSDLSGKHYTTLESLVSNTPKIQAILPVGRVLKEDSTDMPVLVTAIGQCINGCNASDKECKKNCALHKTVEVQGQIIEGGEGPGGVSGSGLSVNSVDQDDECKQKPSKEKCEECCDLKCKHAGTDCSFRCKGKCKK